MNGVASFLPRPPPPSTATATTPKKKRHVKTDEFYLFIYVMSET